MADLALVDAGYRWATVTPDDRSGLLYIVAFLSFTYSSLTFITRCFIKWKVLGLDDFAILVAHIASLVQFALFLVSLSAGLAKNFDLLSNYDYARMAWSQYGNQIALYTSLGFSKLATILLTQRLFTRDMKKAWVLCNIVTAMVVIWTTLVPLLVSAGCSPESTAPKVPSRTCPTIVARYEFVVVTDAITDIFLVAVPSYLCWQLQMSVALKLQVVSVFAFRLPLVALAGLFLKAWIRSLSIENPGVQRTAAITFQQAELCLSLMAATIPCLKSFIRSFDTGSGVKANFGTSDYGSSGLNTNSHTESYKMSSMTRSKTSASREGNRSYLNGDDGEIRVNPRPFVASRSNSTTRNKSFRDTFDRRTVDEVDRRSQGSDEGFFIKRETQWEVTSENARRGSDTNTPGILRLPQ